MKPCISLPWARVEKDYKDNKDNHGSRAPGEHFNHLTMATGKCLADGLFYESHYSPNEKNRPPGFRCHDYPACRLGCAKSGGWFIPPTLDS